jgi:polysaccharide biosynthesis transport protein
MPSPILNQNIKAIAHTLILWLPLWLGVCVVSGLFGGFYAFCLKKDLWLSSQALLVRDEASTTSQRVGRFDSDQQMKAAQETILEVARHEQVVAEAMKAVGPEPSWFSVWGDKNWPSSSAVKSTANSLITIRAPKGAEFGATEVIYLDVRQSTPERALAFNRTLTDALQIRLQEVRRARAESLKTELIHARDLARDYLRQTTEQLQKIERNAGLELSDLRGLTDMIAGGGTSRLHLDQLKSEIRTAETKLREQLDDLSLLEEAIGDPDAFVVAPSSVIESQPGLKRLREGYAEASLNASQLSGRFTEFHPLLEAARRTQHSIQNRLVMELEASRTNLNQEIEGSNQKLNRLKELQKETESKLNGLAEHRAEYANLVAEIKSRTTILETAERELAEIEASANASSSTSLISKLEEPSVSERPIGPGRTTIAGGIAFAGLLLGFAIVFMISPAERRFGRRASDVGRRQNDRLAGLVPEQSSADLIASTLATSATLLNETSALQAEMSDASQLPQSPVDPSRIERALHHTSAPLHSALRPNPIFFDEQKIAELKVQHNAAIDQPRIITDPVQPESSATISSITSTTSESHSNAEHPNDPTFRDLLIDELSKSNDRRQHPRPVQSASIPVQFGLRPKPNA